MKTQSSRIAASACLGALCIAFLPAAAQAQPARQAVVNTGANLRAGPGGNYPVVAQLAPGTYLDVAGCTAGYQWCDVVLPGGARGWVYAAGLSYPYQGRPAPVAQYGAAVGIPLISFAIGNYWGAHYRDRPFYGDRRYWGGHPPPPPRYVQPRPPPPPHWVGGPRPDPRPHFRDGGPPQFRGDDHRGGPGPRGPHGDRHDRGDRGDRGGHGGHGGPGGHGGRGDR